MDAFILDTALVELAAWIPKGKNRFLFGQNKQLGFRFNLLIICCGLRCVTTAVRLYATLTEVCVRTVGTSFLRVPRATTAHGAGEMSASMRLCRGRVPIAKAGTLILTGLLALGCIKMSCDE